MEEMKIEQALKYLADWVNFRIRKFTKREEDHNANRILGDSFNMVAKYIQDIENQKEKEQNKEKKKEELKDLNVEGRKK